MELFTVVGLLLAVVFAWLWWTSLLKIWKMKREALKKDAEEMAYHYRTQQRAEMLHRLVDGIEDGLFIISSSLTVLFVNRGAMRYFPPISGPVGRTLLECVRDHRIVEIVHGSVTSGQRARQELLISSRGEGSGMEDRIFSVEAVPLNGEAPGGMEGGVLVILRDETEKHTLERIRKDFVANASHELRTPLSIINGYLENLVDGDILGPEESGRAFTIMRKHGDRLAQIVEDLLVISRMESGEADAIRVEEFDFRACALDVIHRLTPVITSKEAGVHVVLVDDCSPIIQGDRYYWDQILFNLVGNALKENLARGLRVFIRLKQEGDTSEIQVGDDGVGIPHADLPFVFKRFFRVARHHSKEIKGTGLGLSIVKRAVEAHHGTITLHSRPGIETVFTIRIPRMQRQADALRPSMTLPDEPLRGE